MTEKNLSPDQSLSDFIRITEGLSSPIRFPITITLPNPHVSPATIYRQMRREQGFLLESMEGVPRRAVRSIIGTGVKALITIDGDEDQALDPIHEVRKIMADEELIGSAPAGFAGGLVGYHSYDMVTHLNKGYLNAGKEDGCPIGRFMFVESGVVMDHQAGTCTIFVTPKVHPDDDREVSYSIAKQQVTSLACEVLQIHNENLPECKENPTCNDISVSSSMSKEEYEAAVRKILTHIRAGDIFQAVISRKIETPYTGDRFQIYTEVRELNPSPYLYLLEFGDETVIGSSPEMLVKSDNGNISTVPIAGTRPRGKDPEEDARLAEDMLADEKEKAEHLMLVDLARNDIGKVASFGSVKVASFMEVEKFSHVQHLTSLVTGSLHEKADRFDAFASCFPAGTVSGAPKLRAMQIIADLESRPRGLYAGAVGYIGFDDRLEFAIAIRTVIVKNQVAMFQTGAGIVADSDPTREYEETNQKAGAMLAALRQASSHVCIKTGKVTGGIS